MTFNRIQQYITRDTGVPGTLLIPKLIYPKLIDEADKFLLPKELAAVYQTPAQTANQGSTYTVNTITPNSMDVRQVGEGAEIPMDALDFGTVTITPVKYGVSIRITREMQEDGQFSLFDKHIEYAGKRFAEKETELIIAELHSTTNAVTGGAAVTIADVAEAMNYLEANDYKPTDFLVGDKILQNLRNIDTFVEADKAGNTDMMKIGFLGTVFGMNVCRFSRNVTPTPSTYALYAYIIDRANSYVVSYKRDITIENFDLPSYDMKGAAVTMRLDVEYLRDAATCEITTTG